MNENIVKQLQLFICYLVGYWLLGSIFWLIIFGYDDSISTLFASPKSTLSGTLIFLSTFIATALLFVFKRKAFADRLYPYFIFGFYVGNLSLLVLFILDAFIR
ncbi:hypothetical protein QPW88_15625, partial [Legionella pneumophila]